MNEALIKVTDASLNLAGRMVLKNIDFAIKAGEIAVFIGPNGGGKTSLVKMLLGLHPATTGHIFRQEKLKIAYVPQKFNISPFLPLSVKRLLCLEKNHSDSYLTKILTLTDCAELLHVQVKTLSGGELQRVLIARALMQKPDILILDEALQGVDKVGEVKLNRLIGQFSKDNGCAVIMVSHDLHLVMKSSDKVYCINGHICCQGIPEDIKDMAEFKNIFGNIVDEFSLYQHQHSHDCDTH